MCPLQQARAISGLFANRFKLVLVAFPRLPRVSPVVPAQPLNACGLQPVFRALEPAGGG